MKKKFDEQQTTAMAQGLLLDLLRKAVVDEAFRKEMFDNPNQALLKVGITNPSPEFLEMLSDPGHQKMVEEAGKGIPDFKISPMRGCHICSSGVVSA